MLATLRLNAMSVVYAFSGTMSKTLSSSGTPYDLLPTITTNTPFSGEMIVDFDVDNNGPGGATEYILRGAEYFAISSGGVNFIDTGGGDVTCYTDTAANFNGLLDWSTIQPLLQQNGGEINVDDMLLELGIESDNAVHDIALASPNEVLALATRGIVMDGAFYKDDQPDSTDFSISGSVSEIHIVTGGNPNIVWQNTSTGDRYFWKMNGPTYSSGTSLGNVPASWQIAGVGDFNGDHSNDLVWQNTSTGDRFVWLMDGANFISSTYIGTMAPQWQIAAVADFNGDGQTDIIWQNSSTGDRYVWLMNGTTFASSVYLGTMAPAWQIVGAADFNGDGKCDLVWQNTTTGACTIWLMNGASFSSNVAIGNNGTQWQVAGVADFNVDGKPDLIWQNTASGDRYIWLMNGTSFASSVYVGNVDPTWKIAN